MILWWVVYDREQLHNPLMAYDTELEPVLEVLHDDLRYNDLFRPRLWTVGVGTHVSTVDRSL